MTEVQDKSERRVRRLRNIGLLLALTAMTCWSTLVAIAGLVLATMMVLTGSNFSEPVLQEYTSQAWAILLGAFALALAPWVIGGIVFGVWWWRSKRRRPVEKSE